MHSSIRLILFVLICPLISSALQPYRTFTDAQGRKIQASLISVRGDQVLVRTQDGRQHVLKASMLSPADQQYVAMHGGQPASGMPPGMPDALRRMIPGGPGLQPPPSPPAKPSAPPTTSGASSSGNHGGMALAPGWLPQRTETKRELMESLAFYAKEVVGNAAPGKEPVPGQIIPGITWLMPIDQAVSKLPGRVNKIGERRIDFTCFPADSLTMISFQCNSFVDRGQTFNLLHFIVDTKRQVVGLEFVEQSPGKRIAPYEPQGKLEPYYNFLTLTNNATTKREVVYQIDDAGPGVKLIKTVFRDFANDIPNGTSGFNLPPGMRPPPGLIIPVKVYEIVHWYLAAPFARCLLEIAERNGVRPK